MGPPRGRCKPSSALPGKGRFILRLLETGASDTEDRWERGRRSLQGLTSPIPPARQKEDTCLPILQGGEDRGEGTIGHREANARINRVLGLL